MKIVNIIGGLGNQMFQYAMAVTLKKAFPDEVVKINTSCFNGYHLHNGYELDRIFNVAIPQAKIRDLLDVAYPWIHYRLWQIGRRILPQRKDMAWDSDYKNGFLITDVADKRYFDGYWQSPKFFSKYRDDILNAMQFKEISEQKNIEALQFINYTKTAFVHIRRGDYMNHPVFGGICSDIYYHNGIHILRQEYGYHRFIVFSNDIEWCRQELSELFCGCDVIYADWNNRQDSYRDMQLMSNCRAGIIANSSFSWWGAWLSNSEIILCPTKWTNIKGHRDDIFPSEWRKILIE